MSFRDALHPRSCVVPLVIGLALSASSASGEDRPRDFRFQFEPTAGRVWTKTVLDEQENDFGGVAEGRHQITESRFRQHYEQKDDGGWQLVQVTRDIEMTINGNEVRNPIFDVIIGHEIRLDLDEQGRAVDHDGFSQLMRRYEREIDPDLFARIRQNMSVESMGQGEMLKRNRVLEFVAGREASLGEVWSVEEPLRFQGSVSRVTGTLRFEDWTEIDGQAGVKMVYRYDNTGDARGAAGDEVAREISLLEEGEQIDPNNLVIRGQYTWVMDPRTSQPLYEVQEQTIEIPLGAMDGPRGEIRNAHTWRWTLQDEDAASGSR